MEHAFVILYFCLPIVTNQFGDFLFLKNIYNAGISVYACIPNFPQKISIACSPKALSHAPFSKNFLILDCMAIISHFTILVVIASILDSTVWSPNPFR